MKTAFLAAALALVACGGGGSSERFQDPGGARFSYGAEEAPTAAEAAAAGQAALAALAVASPGAEAGAAASPLAMGGTLPGGAVFASTLELAPASIDQLTTFLLQRGLAAGWSPPDGQLDRSPGLAAWASKVDVLLGDGTVFRVTGFEELSGRLAWTETTLSGSSRADVSLDVFAYGQGDPGNGKQGWHEWHNLWRGVTYGAEYELTYAGAGACAARVTGGTLTVKRLWSALPPYAAGPAFASAAVRFTWRGCGDVPENLTVARSRGAI